FTNNIPGNHAGIATRRTFEGDFTITAEVQNITQSLGLRSVDGEAAWAFVGPFPGNEWHKVVLSCSHGDISCTVDERVVKVDYVNKAKLHKALFYLHVKANDTGAVRRFEVVAGVGKAEI